MGIKPSRLELMIERAKREEEVLISLGFVGLARWVNRRWLVKINALRKELSEAKKEDE